MAEPNENNQQKTETAPVETPKTYSADEFEEMVSAELERRMGAAKKKWEQTARKQVAEAERLSKMSDDERKDARIKELEEQIREKETQIAVRENTISCLAEMGKRQIPADLVSFIVDADADVMLENLSTFEKALKKLVNDEVSRRIDTASVKNSAAAAQPMTKEKFKTLPLLEKQRLYEQDKELFMSMLN